ncbi:MAG: cytochrome P450 [Myxococcota bacterium]
MVERPAPIAYAPPVRGAALRDVPRRPRPGDTLALLVDARGAIARWAREHGPVFKTRFLGDEVSYLLGEDALALLLRDKEGRFSSELGWGLTLRHLFPRGLMLRDGDDHLRHRRLLQAAFSTAALEGYLARMDRIAAAHVEGWPEVHRMRPALKALTLEVATDVLFGAKPGTEGRRLMRAFERTVGASLALLRTPLPGTRFRRGLEGRAEVAAFVRARLPAARRGGEDVLSRLARAEVEGERLADEAIVDHLIFLWMAAHDTVTSTLAFVSHYLAVAPAWQERLREELAGAAVTLAGQKSCAEASASCGRRSASIPPCPSCRAGRGPRSPSPACASRRTRRWSRCPRGRIGTRASTGTRSASTPPASPRSAPSIWRIPSPSCPPARARTPASGTASRCCSRSACSGICWPCAAFGTWALLGSGRCRSPSRAPSAGSG